MRTRPAQQKINVSRYGTPPKPHGNDHRGGTRYIGAYGYDGRDRHSIACLKVGPGKGQSEKARAGIDDIKRVAHR